MESRAVLIPVKAFDAAKGRLAPALDHHARAALARSLADAVVAACAGLDVFVVCEDPGVAAWAHDAGAAVLPNPEPGLNAAVRHGIAALARLKVDRVLIAHADLARPTTLPDLFARDGIVLVPDRRLDGTNAMVVPPGAGFSFSYGPGSFARHLSEADRLGLPVHVVRDVGLALDLDEPDDLSMFHPTADRSGAAS
jgi:2-phospho-L-lactate guanylyltransferase